MQSALRWKRAYHTCRGVRQDKRSIRAADHAAGCRPGPGPTTHLGGRGDRPVPPGDARPLPATSGIQHRRHAELALLDGRHRLRAELVVDEDVATHVPRLPLRALHLVANEVRV